MTKINGFNITEHQWINARKAVFAVNQPLAELIDQLNLTSEHVIYEANYRYGELILDEGKLMLPNSDSYSVPFDGDNIPNKLKQNLSYSSAPIGLIMSNSVEVFIESGLDVIPLVVLSPGRTLGLLETLDPVGTYCLRHIWSSSAGARSVYMLPKISDKIAHARLQREFGLTITPPKNYFDHFNVFKKILNAQESSNKKWELKIFFFSESWLKLNPFVAYLKHHMIQNSSYARNKATFDVLWHFFSKELTEKSRKPNSYVLDTLKHIVKILIGAVPGYAPVYCDETRGPFSSIQKVYLDLYRLNAIPTIFAPYHFLVGDKKSQPVLHSMNNPGMFETIPRMREPESLITDLVQAESLFKSFYESGKNGKLKIKQTILEKAFDVTELTYFHANPGKNYFGIKLSSTLPHENNKLVLHQYSNEYQNLKFAEHGEFAKSCILIKNKEF